VGRGDLKGSVLYFFCVPRIWGGQRGLAPFPPLFIKTSPQGGGIELLGSRGPFFLRKGSFFAVAVLSFFFLFLALFKEGAFNQISGGVPPHN